jgi:hypothetical protein
MVCETGERLLSQGYQNGWADGYTNANARWPAFEYAIMPRHPERVT